MRTFKWNRSIFKKNDLRRRPHLIELNRQLPFLLPWQYNLHIEILKESYFSCQSSHVRRKIGSLFVKKCIFWRYILSSKVFYRKIVEICWCHHSQVCIRPIRFVKIDDFHQTQYEICVDVKRLVLCQMESKSAKYTIYSALTWSRCLYKLFVHRYSEKTSSRQTHLCNSMWGQDWQPCRLSRGWQV